MPISIRTGYSCCDKLLSFTADDKPPRGIHGQYGVRGTKLMYASVQCETCGLVYDPDATRFAGCFNEAVDRLFG
jgi:hypothetical protein